MLTCTFPPTLLLAASKRTGQELDTVTRVACCANMALATTLGTAATAVTADHPAVRFGFNAQCTRIIRYTMLSGLLNCRRVGGRRGTPG